ncbi:MAG: MoxR family ATPase [Candidatus Odinarchaeum yellowstonii]|uniref:MoxR family ATPase n=1 Tax=Odinarchaeota yellowstonii (strain LCB_4) TaxID=1841599 RepID=A0AAF0D373_ODILC|nr:MAG: MoxR family ATPase [Candidatus Odinarchaeum yellowstonii]
MSRLNFITDEATSSSAIEIIAPNPSEYIPVEVPPFVDTNNQTDIIKLHLEAEPPQPLLFIGFKGTGKTLAFATVAYQLKIPIIQADLSENTKRGDLIGRFILRGSDVVYQLGILPSAILIANSVGRAILVLEELNALTPQMQKVLNQLLDWRGQVHAPEIGKIFRLNKGCKLLIGATSNPSNYGGVFEINEDLRSRFATLWFGYPKKEDELRILHAYGSKDDNLNELLITLAVETRKAVDRNEIEYALSPRDLVRFTQIMKIYKSKFSEEEALRKTLEIVVLGKYEDVDERQLIARRIESIFGLKMGEELNDSENG